MIAVDTNLLVRLLIQDDPAQARAVERLFVRARRDRTPLFIADVVLCELVCVLALRANQPRAGIADALEQLLDTESIVVAVPGIARAALAAYRDGTGDFADYLIREQAAPACSSEVVTFDKALRGERGFKILG